MRYLTIKSPTKLKIGDLIFYENPDGDAKDVKDDLYSKAIEIEVFLGSLSKENYDKIKDDVVIGCGSCGFEGAVISSCRKYVTFISGKYGTLCTHDFEQKHVKKILV